MKFLTNLLLLTSFVFSSSVWAHANLTSSSPAKGAILNASPSSLELSFSAPVRIVRLSLRDKTQTEVAIEQPSMSQSQAEYSLVLPTLTDSTYTASWIMMGEDGHKMTEKLQFTLHRDTTAHH